MAKGTASLRQLRNHGSAQKHAATPGTLPSARGEDGWAGATPKENSNGLES
jgi:hypothetical protein